MIRFTTTLLALALTLACSAEREPDDAFGSLDGTSAGASSDESGGASEGPGDTGDDGGGIKYDVKDEGGDGDGDPDGVPEFPKTCEEAASGNSSVGCEFYPLRLPGVEWEVVGFSVSNVSDHVANVTLSAAYGVLEQVQVPPGEVHVFSQDHHDPNVDDFRGFVIESDQVLQVWQFLPITAESNNDASIVFPRQSLGTRHRIATWSGNMGGYVKLVGIEDGTQVTFTLANGGASTGGEYGRFPPLNGAGDSFTVTLDRLQVLTIYGNKQLENPLTGSLVESSKPVAVYSGNTCLYIPGGDCCCDLIATAVPPTTTYGDAYAAVKLLPVTKGYDVWRVIGDKDGTTITLSGDEGGMFQLDAGGFVDIESTGNFWIEGSEPFGVVRFMTAGWFDDPDRENKNAYPTYDCGVINAPGDPALSWIFPPANWLNRYLLITGSGLGSQSNWCNATATIIAPTDRWNDVTFDGGPLPSGTPLANGDMSFAYVDAPGDSHEVEAPPDVPVGLEVYGYIHNGSYYYPGGVGMKTLNPPEG
jgi:hypothetical protein